MTEKSRSAKPKSQPKDDLEKLLEQKNNEAKALKKMLEFLEKSTKSNKFTKIILL